MYAGGRTFDPLNGTVFSANLGGGGGLLVGGVEMRVVSNIEAPSSKYRNARTRG